MIWKQKPVKKHDFEVGNSNQLGNRIFNFETWILPWKLDFACGNMSINLETSTGFQVRNNVCTSNVKFPRLYRRFQVNNHVSDLICVSKLNIMFPS